MSTVVAALAIAQVLIGTTPGTLNSATDWDEDLTQYDDTDAEDDDLEASPGDLATKQPLVLELEPAGFAVSPVYSLGAGVGYGIAGPLSLEAAYARGSGHVLSRRVAASLTTVRMKVQAYRSFYVAAGVAERTVSGELDPEDAIPGGGNGETASVTVFGGDLAVGNGWQLGRRFVLACDWVGIVTPWKTLAAHGDAATPALSGDDRSFYQLAHRNSLQLLRVYLGIAF
jgi:hypothetical protein